MVTTISLSMIVMMIKVKMWMEKIPAREMRMTKMTILSISSAIVRAHPPSPGIRHLRAHRPATPGMTMLMIFVILVCFSIFVFSFVLCFLYLSPSRARDNDADDDDDDEDVDEDDTDGEEKEDDGDDSEGDACLFERWPR